MELFARCDRELERLLAVTEEGKRYTLGDLNAAAERIAGAVGEHRLVFVLCENTPGTLLGYLGCLKAGEVPLLLDAHIAPELLRGLLETYRPAFVHVPGALPAAPGRGMEGFVPALSASLGLFIPLIVVNCVILGRAEAFSSKNSIGASALDGIFQGIGYMIVLIIMSVVREFLGAGTFGGGILNGGDGIRIIPESGAALGMILPVGGFLTLGVVIAVAQYLMNRPKKNKEVAK